MTKKNLALLRADVRKNGPEFVLQEMQAAARAMLETPGVPPAAVEASFERMLAEVFDEHPR